jgi:hypothetical protein
MRRLSAGLVMFRRGKFGVEVFWFTREGRCGAKRI